MLRDGFLRFCDDPELACCRAEAELGQLRAENTQLHAELAESHKKFSTQNLCRAGLTSEIHLNRLEQICEAERDGRLVVLPCKVGDTVYKLTSDALSGIEETKINRIVIKKNKITFNADCINDDWGRAAWDIRVCDFGKTVFLTREEAEKALQEGLKC